MVQTDVMMDEVTYRENSRQLEPAFDGSRPYRSTARVNEASYRSYLFLPVVNLSLGSGCKYVCTASQGHPFLWNVDPEISKEGRALRAFERERLLHWLLVLQWVGDNHHWHRPMYSSK